MENEDGPNFSYAYGRTSATPAPSWNPALRPNAENAQSAAPIQKPSEPSSGAVLEPETIPAGSEAQVDELPTAPALPPHPSSSIFDTELTSDDDFFDRYGAPDIPQAIPQSPINEINRAGSGAAAEEVLANNGQQSIESGAPAFQGASEGLNGTPVPIQGKKATENGDTIEDHPPAENYEHQGETTLLEEAVTESSKIPLVANSEATTDDWGSSGEVFDLGGKPQDAPISTPQAEAVGTTVGDQVVGNTTIRGNTGEGIEGGTTEEQDFFGSNKNPTVESQEPTPRAPGSHVRQPSKAKAAAGDDSMWDLALDDDFLPDHDDAVAPFELDDDGFLEDELSQPGPAPTQQIQSSSSTASRYAPQAAHAPKPASNAYGLQGPQFTDFSQMDQKKPMATPTVAYGAYNQSSPYQQQAQRHAMTSSAQSFVDKAKGGYHSPYDLPEDIVTTRKRPAVHHATISPVQPAPPPPRSSSMYANTSAGAPRPPPPSNMSASSLSPPSSSHSMKSPMSGMPPNAPPKPAATSKGSSSDFFAELPVTSKPKPSGRYTPQQNTATPVPPPGHFTPPHFPPKERTSSWSSLRNEVLPDTTNLISELQQPERLPVFPDLPAPARSNSLPVPQPAPAPPSAPPRYSPAPPPSAPSANARYSPVPPAALAASSRYSPAPPQQPNQGPAHNRYVSEPPVGPSRPPAQPYAPRTSSPLAYHTHPEDQQQPSQVAQEHTAHHVPGHHVMHSADGVPRVPLGHPLEEVSEIEEQEQEQEAATVPPMTARSGTPPLRSSPSSTIGSPRKRTNYTPQYQPGPLAASNMPPPRRSQSQSPGATMKNPLHSVSSIDRPASMHGPTSPSSGFGAQNVIHNVANIIPHRRQISHEFEYIAPQDERAADPLGRWKGYPIFKWGLGGTVVTSFPKQIPRYGGGSSVPMMKCSPGEVKLQSIKEALPLPDDIPKFPGPLKSKSKKKDISTWLGLRIEGLESQLKMPGLEHTMNPEAVKRLEERVLLWKIMQVFVDNDGHLEGNANTESAVRKVLSPEEVDPSADSSTSFATRADLVGISRSNTSAVQAEPVDPRAVEELRILLTKGDREKAVWHAVDQRLWAHAMLLSSTLNKDIWKQVVQEFVRKEVKKVGYNNQPLSVLYEIFAGNWEDCIDELVPASARAGFQMMTTDGAGSTQNVLQGLDKWRETLCLVLSNRSESDVQALVSLGKLLAGYGRVEAAHICFIFARGATYVGGVDDPQSDIVLLGADHRLNPLDMGSDLESVLLTEVYEFALSLSAPGGSYVIPHLQTYKLTHAYALAEYGYRTEAQAYCDSVATAMKSTTRISPYYNASFIASLDDLSKRLSQSPKDPSSSWISKPSMDKVSTTLLSKFNSFIAGDDEDAASNHSGGNDVGPFAKIAGNTPTISPSHSSADLYGAYSSYGGAAASPSGPPANSRYAPTNAYAPRGSLDQGRSRYEPQGRPSLESAEGSFRQTSDSHLLSPQLSGPYTPSQPQHSPPSQRTQAPKAQYSPLKQDGMAPLASYGSPYQPTPPAEESVPSFGGYQPPQTSFDGRPASPPSEPAHTSGGYEPPSMGYAPPFYQPYQADDEEEGSPIEQPKKKKSFMDDDDDDDFASRAAALKQQQKAEADRHADEAFRKAAEADEAKAKAAEAAKKSGGWFGGWFKKDANAAPGPIKAKLGEENSFVYDPELKKWVNKKAGAEQATRPMATPPPPKSGPPGRSVSGNSVAANHAMGQLGSSLPGSGPPSRPPTSNPQRSSSMPPPMSGAQSRASTPGIPSDSEGKPPTLMPPNLGSGPPSRPSTGMSNASSIEDLIGAPQARKGGTVKKGKRGGRYVDVMAKP
ncbi:hypothetical protein K469DRAFT_219588 [Zopfia rhizophila CBS 207.26]|uniref:Protein transport protein sec16 n=1 Tax=Zopfia rhizophila CBS 207.26 TaxID=1314779 RepID=A0A6A6DSX9_9PEZI|nr:hypothetical protein K469DRAFT_219588 [Zopfia rhizophila CBS 207.26]